LGRRKHHYRLGVFDFLAVYIVPEAIWYIIPAELACRRARNLLLTPHRSTSKYHKYREAWHLLSANPAAVRPSPPATSPGRAEEACGIQAPLRP